MQSGDKDGGFGEDGFGGGRRQLRMGKRGRPKAGGAFGLGF